MRTKYLFVSVLISVVTSFSAQSQQWQGTSPIYYNAGNVGIGTATPDSKLQIIGNTDIGEVVDPTKYGILQLARPANQGDNKFHLSFIRYGNSVSGMGYAPNSNVLGIWHANNNQGTPLMSFTYTQNVGIRTSNPTDALQIGDRFVFQDGGWKGILSNVSWNSSLGKNARLVAAPVAGFFFTDRGNTAFLNGPQNTAGSTTDDCSYSMVLYSSGQVGVGTSYNVSSFNDASYKLYVEGGIRTRKVKVDQTTWADYVFHANYHLRPLHEVEQYIQQNHHLPEVPSAEEVKKDGLDVGDNQATLLKKIEELTLYVIDLNNKLQQETKNQQQLQSQVKDLQEENLRLNKSLKNHTH
jgi:hypothetical protein